VPDLEKLVADRAVAADRRLGALWALEGLKTVGTALLQLLAPDPNPMCGAKPREFPAAQRRPEASPGPSPRR